MPQIPLKGGFYQGRSIISDAQRCLNLYPEKNPEDSPSPYVYLQTPGLVTVAQQGAQWRGTYLATNGSLYAVIDSAIFKVGPPPAWTLTNLGPLATSVGTCYMVDNGTTMVVVDGSNNGYLIDLVTGAYSKYLDPSFVGATRCDILDGFMLFNQPNTRNFYSTLDNVTTIDPLYIAAKSGFPDKVSTLIVMHREIWLLGTQFTTEVWYNAGNPAFPFAFNPGVFIEHGCAAPYSIAKHDLMIFWLSVDKDGQATVYRGSNYAAQKISTPGLAAQLSGYSTISDAIGMTYKQQDHIFYVLTFPTADKTWVYDASEGLWHERAWVDTNGVEHRIRANTMVFAYGVNLCGDWQNGKLYQMDLAAIDDDGNDIVRRRGFSHLIADGSRVQYPGLRADMEVGDWSNTQVLNVFLRWSDDRGRTFGNPVKVDVHSGEYLAQPQWTHLGYARDRVFELFWSSKVQVALQGAWLWPPIPMKN